MYLEFIVAVVFWESRYTEDLCECASLGMASFSPGQCPLDPPQECVYFGRLHSNVYPHHTRVSNTHQEITVSSCVCVMLACLSMECVHASVFSCDCECRGSPVCKTVTQVSVGPLCIHTNSIQAAETTRDSDNMLTH